MKNIVSTGLAAISLLAATQAVAQDCTPQHQVTTVDEGFLTIAAPTFPPFSTPLSEDDVTGIDGEIVKEIAARECLKIKVEQVEYATAIPYVVSGRADLAIGNFYRTAERGKVVDMSLPLYIDQMGLFSRDGVATVSGLEGRPVGTVQGYLWVNELKKILGDDLRLYNNYVALYQDLESNRIEVAIDGMAIGTAAQQGGALTDIKLVVTESDERVAASVAPPQAGLPMAKGNDELLGAINEIVTDLHDSGRLTEIMVEFGMPGTATDVGEPRLVQ